MPSWWGKSSAASSPSSSSGKEKKERKVNGMRLQIAGWKSKLSSWTDDDKNNASSPSPKGYRSSSDSNSVAGSRSASPCPATADAGKQPWPLPSSPFCDKAPAPAVRAKSPSLPLPLPALEVDSSSSGSSFAGSDVAPSTSTKSQVDDVAPPRSPRLLKVRTPVDRSPCLSPRASSCLSPRAILDAPLFCGTGRDKSPNLSPVPSSPRLGYSPRVQSAQVSPRHPMHHSSPSASSTFSLSSTRCERPPTTRWQRGKLIGTGSFGKVYVGFDSEDMGRMCAMKEVVIIRDDQKSKESAGQLEQEVRVLSGLRHPNIVQYYGSECLEDKLCIYLEYVSGGSIHKLLQDYGPFKKSVIRNYTKQILCGLSYLHGVQTVHRDIKGANILVDTNGTVKLADFGMAKIMTAHSMPLSCKGSPYWMAPEIINQTHRCDLSVDIWSLGCTIIEMATGKPPWSEYEGVAVMFKIVNCREEPPIPDCLGADGIGFLRLCLRRNPADRPTATKTLNPEGKDVTEIIIEEHRLVETLGQRYQTETNVKEKQGIAHNIIKLLSIHAVCEEAALYPWMKKNLPNGEKLVDHAIHEHQEIKEDLYKLDQMTIGDAGYDATLLKALADTEHHVKEEESDLLPSIKAKASKDELEQLRTEFLRAKMMAPSRPHPSAPTEPPQNKVVAAATAPIDAVRDMGRFSS